MIVDLFLQPQFLIAAFVILGGTFLAFRLTRRRFVTEATVDRKTKENAPAERPDVDFTDVAGLDEAVTELREVKDYLEDPDRFGSLGADLPRGILLYGPPGCGKTLLARALAGETGVPFYYVSAASFVEKFVGLGAARVRELFAEAKKRSPAIVFIDELDAVGRKRSGEAQGEREFDNTLNQLLVELDGFTGASGVLILAATNRPELIDSALLRPGRFDRRIQIERPDLTRREQVLRLHGSRRPVSRQVDWATIAHETPGLTAAELANIVNEAALLAARRQRSKVTTEDVDEALERVLSGTRTSRLMTDETKTLIAVHEVGHALMTLLLRGIKPPARVSILNRTDSFGRSAWSFDDAGEIRTKRDLMAQLMVLLGGRAAELNVFGEPSTRAEDDLEHAAALAKRMVERWAMTGRFELAGKSWEGIPTGPGRAEAEIRTLIARAETAARSVLKDRSEQLGHLAAVLAERETITTSEIGEMAGLSAWRHHDQRFSVVGASR